MNKTLLVVASFALVVLGLGVIFVKSPLFKQKTVPPQLISEPQPTVSEPTKISGLRYENEKYGFALNLPSTWQGYKVTVHEPEDIEKIKDVCFSFESGSLPICILQINIFTKNQWKELKTRLAYLGETDEFVFSYSYSPECVQHDEFQCARAKEVPEIIKTFTLFER